MGAMAGMGTMFPTTTPGVPTMMFPRVNDFFGASAVSPLPPAILQVCPLLIWVRICVVALIKTTFLNNPHDPSLKSNRSYLGCDWRGEGKAAIVPIFWLLSNPYLPCRIHKQRRRNIKLFCVVILKLLELVRWELLADLRTGKLNWGNLLTLHNLRLL